MRYVINEKVEDCIKSFQKIAKEKGVSLTMKGNTLVIPDGKKAAFEKIFDDVLKDFNKNNKCSVSWKQDDDSKEIKFFEKEEKKKESVEITLDNDYKINETIIKKGTKVFIKETKEAEEDIIVERASKLNDIIVSKGEIVSFVEAIEEDNNKELKERKIPREWNRYQSLMNDVYEALEDAGIDVRAEYSEYEDTEVLVMITNKGTFELALYEID